MHELAKLQTQQPLNLRTGSVHAAAWALPGKGIQLVREDVGRHNALDKVIGALVRAGTDLSRGLSHHHQSRELRDGAEGRDCRRIAGRRRVRADGIGDRSWPMETGVTLIGFARADRHVVYAHPQRLRD